ncbi:MAG: hypothetical protein LBR91_01635 [Puniceicoccales bacterium]|nr:hypothetical protein [Puniceicoccales bacterium]
MAAQKIKIFILSLLWIFACIGCNSITKIHHSTLERMYQVQDEIAEISKKMQDIEQIMLYVGRVRDGPLADAALDVAIAIHGEPDEMEKRYAENITVAEIETLRAQVASLANRRAQLEAISAGGRRRVMNEAYSMHGIESRYKLLETIVGNCAMAVCVTVVIFVIRKLM